MPLLSKTICLETVVKTFTMPERVRATEKEKAVPVYGSHCLLTTTHAEFL